MVRCRCSDSSVCALLFVNSVIIFRDFSNSFAMISSSRPIKSNIAVFACKDTAFPAFYARLRRFMSTFVPERWSLPIGRVVYRGYNNANANGGVSNANANNDASNTNTNVGSRLENQSKRAQRQARLAMPSAAWFHARKSNNRRTARGTCPRSGAEGGKPQQQHPHGWKAEKSRVGWSLVGRQRLEEVRPGGRKAFIFHY